MSSFLRALQPLKTAADAFFRHDLKLRRGERGLEIALDEPSPEARLSKAERAEFERRQRDAALLEAMRSDLATLLDEGDSTRRTMRALVLFESALRSDGLAALDKVPLPVLAKALEQFEGLVSNWSAIGLATLRSKMAVAHRQRRDAEIERATRPPPASGAPSAASTRPPGAERASRSAPDAGPSISVAMQESRQDLEGAEVEELEFDVEAQLAAAYAANGSAPALPHPQAPTAAEDEAAALAAAYAALGTGPASGSRAA